jgi:hypothetical protein
MNPGFNKVLESIIDGRRENSMIYSKILNLSWRGKRETD